MPVFKAINGKYLWVPAEAVLLAEQGEGGLTTLLKIIPPPGSPPGALVQAEVEGTVMAVGAQLDEAKGLRPAGATALMS